MKINPAVSPIWARDRYSCVGLPFAGSDPWEPLAHSRMDRRASLQAGEDGGGLILAPEPRANFVSRMAHILAPLLYPFSCEVGEDIGINKV